MYRQNDPKYAESWISWTIGITLVFGLRYIMTHVDDFERDTPPDVNVSATMKTKELLAAGEDLLSRLSEDDDSESDRESDVVRVPNSDVANQSTSDDG